MRVSLERENSRRRSAKRGGLALEYSRAKLLQYLTATCGMFVRQKRNDCFLPRNGSAPPSAAAQPDQAVHMRPSIPLALTTTFRSISWRVLSRVRTTWHPPRDLRERGRVSLSPRAARTTAPAGSATTGNFRSDEAGEEGASSPSTSRRKIYDQRDL